MATKRASKRSVRSKRAIPKARAIAAVEGSARELVILTGLSGAGKASALKAVEQQAIRAKDRYATLRQNPKAVQKIQKATTEQAA